MAERFADRMEAGRVLAEKLIPRYGNRGDLVILGLPRGGIPVAYEVAHALNAPLDVFVVRKLGTPGREELAMGAIASGGLVVINDDVVESLGISRKAIAAEIISERAELERREAAYRGNRGRLNLAGKVVILVDDGLATGSTMHAAMAAARRESPSRIVVAVPVASAPTYAEFRSIADECFCVITPEPFRAVGCWYTNFSQITDDEVREVLETAWARELR